MTLLLGSDDVYVFDTGTAFGAGGGYVDAWKFTALATGTIDTMEFIWGERPGPSGHVPTDLYMGVWEDVSGARGALLGTGPVGTIIAEDWNTVSGVSIPVVIGTEYWFGYNSNPESAFLCPTSDPDFSYTKAGSNDPVTGCPDPFPDSYDGTGFSRTSMRATGSTGGGGGGTDDFQTVAPDIIGDNDVEVRLIPLLMPDGPHYHIGLSESTLVEQYADFEWEHPLNLGTTCKFVLAMDDPLVADLEPWEFAVWIGYKRPGNILCEEIYCGKATIEDDYENGVCTITSNLTESIQHHYVRFGDDALTNPDEEKGEVTRDFQGIGHVLQAAQNLASQDLEDIPVLGLTMGDDYGDDTSLIVGIERGQEVHEIISLITKVDDGPDIVYRPDYFPIYNYALIDVYSGPLAVPDATKELGRYLAPVDVDDPQPGEVIFGYGYPEDSLTGCDVTPQRPTTHAHVTAANQDEGAAYRRTAANIVGAKRTGIYVDWISTDIQIASSADADTEPLHQVALNRVRAYGIPVKYADITLRPDAVQTYHYGNPRWENVNEPDNTFGDFYIGDRIWVRALRGYRSFAGLYRIVNVKFTKESSNGLLVVTLGIIPNVDATVDNGED